MPNLRVQTVAARSVGRALIEAAVAAPAGRAADVAGPGQADLVTLARLLAERLDLGVEVQPLDPDLPSGALLPDDGARIAGPSFEEWLTTEDATRLGVLV